VTEKISTAGAKVLVCGSNYGRYYIAAVAHAQSCHQLIGLLARGSERSQRLAHRRQVPLHHEVAELPEPINLACVAVSSPADELVLGLIERRIDVICEHPQPSTLVQQSLDLAERLGVCFHINGHFADLAAPQSFIEQCAEQWRSAPPRLIRILVNDRSLYAALDIIGRSAGSLVPFNLELIGNEAPFAVIQGRLSVTRLMIQAQTSGETGEPLGDGSPDYLLDCRITAVFDCGTLTMMSLAGPVVWSHNLGWVKERETRLWRAGPEQAATAGELREQRVLANLRALDLIVEHRRSGVIPPAQTPQHLLGVSTAWQACGNLLGQTG
jgi:thiazolinyl imide reductase